MVMLPHISDTSIVKQDNSSSFSITEKIDRIIGTLSSSDHLHSHINVKGFIPALKWQGPKPGYYFGSKINHGMGYHLDTLNIDQIHPDMKKIWPKNNGTEDFILKKKTGQELLEEVEKNLASDPINPKTISFSLSSIINLRKNISKLSRSLERTITKNSLLRSQNTSHPEKFMESELALYDEIESYKSLVTSENLGTCLKICVELGIVKSLIDCLSHDNIDVACTTLELFVELLDPESLLGDDNENVIEESKEVRNMGIGLLAMTFVGYGVSDSGLEFVIDNLGRLHDNTDEEVEQKGIENVLTLIEHLLDLDRLGVLKFVSPSYKSIVSLVLTSTTFISWLFIKVGFNKVTSISNDKESSSLSTIMDIKLHCSEVLAMILHHEDAKSSISNLSLLPPYRSTYDDDKGTRNIKKLEIQRYCDGMEILLQSIAIYRKCDPKTEEECETLENILDALSASLWNNESNLDTFVQKQGIELMLRCVRERVHSSHGCLKVLSFALSGPSFEMNNIYKRTGEYFIDIGGLKSLFAVYMGQSGAFPRPAICSDAGRKLNIKSSMNYVHKESRYKSFKIAKREWKSNILSYTIQILYILFRYIDDTSPNDAKLRLYSKFIESNFEKCSRTVDLCLQYDEKMRRAEYRYYKSDVAEEVECYKSEMATNIDMTALHFKLKGGGDLFYRLGAIAGFVSMCSRRCHDHIINHLKTQNSGIGVIKSAINDFLSILDDGDERSMLAKCYNSI